MGIHPSTSTTIDDATEELQKAMMTEFGHFDPKIQKMISKSSHMKRWPLFIHDPLPNWIRGRVILIGDAAHPMLPFGGQGATQAMEDGAALGCLLKDQKDDTVDSALKSFETIRKNRTARVQILSSVRAGLESQVADKIEPYLDDVAPKAPANHIERVAHDFGYVFSANSGSAMVDGSLTRFLFCFSYDVYAACAIAAK